MQIEMIQGRTYVDMLSKKTFTMGVPQEVDDETGTRLLQVTSSAGVPFFRMSVKGVNRLQPLTEVTDGPTPATREVTPTEQARAMRRAGATPVKFGANKAKTGAPAGHIEPPEDGGVAV